MLGSLAVGLACCSQELTQVVTKADHRLAAGQASRPSKGQTFKFEGQLKGEVQYSSQLATVQALQQGRW